MAQQPVEKYQTEQTNKLFGTLCKRVVTATLNYFDGHKTVDISHS